MKQSRLVKVIIIIVDFNFSIIVSFFEMLDFFFVDFLAQRLERHLFLQTSVSQTSNDFKTVLKLQFYSLEQNEQQYIST
jgi:hypothetical protein